jgi:hypothetical protein
MHVVSGSYQNYQNGAVSHQLADVKGGGGVLGMTVYLVEAERCSVLCAGIIEQSMGARNQSRNRGVVPACQATMAGRPVQQLRFPAPHRLFENSSTVHAIVLSLLYYT